MAKANVSFTSMRASGCVPLPDKAMRLADTAGVGRGERIGLGASDLGLAAIQ